MIKDPQGASGNYSNRFFGAGELVCVRTAVVRGASGNYSIWRPGAGELVCVRPNESGARVAAIVIGAPALTN